MFHVKKMKTYYNLNVNSKLQGTDIHVCITIIIIIIIINTTRERCTHVEKQFEAQ